MSKSRLALILITLFLLRGATGLHAQSIEWIEQLGTSSDDRGRSVAIGPFGDIYIAGETEGSLDGSNSGGRDAFVARFNSSGDVRWIVQFGTIADEYVADVAPDDSGDILVTGSTFGSLGEENAGEDDIFLVKIDSEGVVTRITQFGTGASDTARSVALDGSGNIYLSGNTSGSLGGPGAGGDDAFLALLDEDGFPVRIEQFGGSGHDSGADLAIDPEGYIGLAGTIGGDAFASRFHPGGERFWLESFGSVAESDRGTAVGVDHRGNTYVGGYTLGTVAEPHAGYLDVILAKYDPAGERRWIRQLGTTRDEWCTGVAVDRSGSSIVAGSMNGLPGEVAPYDAFVAAWDESGLFRWLLPVGSSASDYGEGITVDDEGYIYLVGTTQGDPGAANRGGKDAFLAKIYAPCEYCDLDEDTIPDYRDNCPEHPNPSQSDRDFDGKGDPCDPAPLDTLILSLTVTDDTDLAVTWTDIEGEDAYDIYGGNLPAEFVIISPSRNGRDDESLACGLPPDRTEAILQNEVGTAADRYYIISTRADGTRSYGLINEEVTREAPCRECP